MDSQRPLNPFAVIAKRCGRNFGAGQNNRFEDVIPRFNGGIRIKAIRIHEFGGPEVLRIEDIPVPQPNSDEIRIRVVAAGINPIDWKIRKGLLKLPLPLTMGLDVSGTVDAVGAKVDRFHLSDQVFAKALPAQGGYAEYTIVNESQAAIKPLSVGFVEAAAVPTAGLAAWQMLFDIAGLKSNQKILIHGAAGGIGSYALQFAKWRGAYVIGTASAGNLDFIKSLGADKLIDYRSQKFEHILHDLDVVIDTVGRDTFDRSWKVLRPGGILVTSVVDIPGGSSELNGVRAKLLVSQANGNELAQIAQLIDKRIIKPAVTVVLPFKEAWKGQEISESGHARGKMVLRVAEDPV